MLCLFNQVDTGVKNSIYQFYLVVPLLSSCALPRAGAIASTVSFHFADDHRWRMSTRCRHRWHNDDDGTAHNRTAQRLANSFDVDSSPAMIRERALLLPGLCLG